MKKLISIGILIWVFLSLGAAAFASAVDSAEIEGFTIMPYVLDPDTESATIAFHLDRPIPAVVLLFDGERPAEHRSPGHQTAHFVQIEGLRPGRVYRYEVIAGDGRVRTPAGDPGYAIKTAGQAGDSFHFAVFGDPRPGDTGTYRHHRAVIEAVTDLEPGFYLLLGDMVDNGNQMGQWRRFFNIEHELMRRTAAFPVLGDNDVASGNGLAPRFFPRLSKGYYRFQWAGVQFFALNAWGGRGEQDRSELAQTSRQMQWFKSELALPEVKKAPFRVVFMHDPVYISRGRSADILKNEWAPVFEANNIDLVFSSWHLYERSHHNGVSYVITGGAGAELIWMPPDPDYASQAEARAHHFCRVDVNSRFMTVRAVATDGTVLDELTLTPKAGAVNAKVDSDNIAHRIQKEILIESSPNSPVLPIYLFSYDCPYCRRLLGRILPSLAQTHGISLKISYFDLSLPDSYPLFLIAGQAFGRQHTDLPAIFVGNRVIGGESHIQERLARELLSFKTDPASYASTSLSPFELAIDVDDAKSEAFDALTLGLVLGAGLLDGLNPCAFATIILLISYLALFGADQRTVIWSGAGFTMGVFFSYLTIGLVFYHSLRHLFMNATVSAVINSVLLIVVLILGVLSLVDTFHVMRCGRSRQLLKLPQSTSRAIEQRVARFARRGSVKIGAPFALGAIIAGMEFTCTGQVYVPIVTMLSEPRYRLSALNFLVAYNVAFILPLIAVFFGAAFGVGFVKAERSQTFLVLSKVGRSIMFLIMALIIIHNLGVI